MSERKLATIQQISKIEPIENSDNLEVATVKGWKVVTQKGQYQPGDLCIYCEIDSFLPDTNPDFEFLKKTSHRKMGDRTGYRLKTLKLRGQVSQGLLLPFENLETGTSINIPSEWAELTGLIGKDITEKLGIVKWEPPIPAELNGVMKGGFPSFVPRTDEERVQNLDYNELKQHLYTASEKLNGSSITCYLKDGEFGVCSRNMELECDENNTFWKTVIKLDVENIMREMQTTLAIDFALQGELIGEGIQGNPYKIKGHTIRFFTMYNITQDHRVDSACFYDLLYDTRLEHVPVLADVTHIPDTMEEILKVAEGKSVINPPTEREGIVYRATHDARISFKVISNKFLIKEKS
jgi:RNA ligase (TIGR02306 family)